MMLSEKSFLSFATHAYRNPVCMSAQEFMDDLARIRYIKRLLNRYVTDNDCQCRLILNHIITFYNVFDIACANEMLFFRCEKESWPALKAFLVFLNYLPEDYMVDVEVDVNVLALLNKI